MEYREYRPCPELASIVTVIWTLEGHARETEGEAQPVLPDGQPELVIHLGDAFARVHSDGLAERQPVTLFAGQLTEQLVLQPTGRIAVLGVRFRPFGAAAMLLVPQQQLTGLTVDLAAVAPPLTRELDAVRSQTEDLFVATRLMQAILLRHVHRSRVDPRVRAAVDAIHLADGMLSMDDLAREADMTRRHLERRFLEDVGIPPKRLARITRFQRALRLLDDVDGTRKGAETAVDCGYADQSHFIREFRELAGCSPSEHLMRRAELTAFFIDGPSRQGERPSRNF